MMRHAGALGRLGQLEGLLDGVADGFFHEHGGSGPDGFKPDGEMCLIRDGDDDRVRNDGTEESGEAGRVRDPVRLGGVAGGGRGISDTGQSRRRFAQDPFDVGASDEARASDGDANRWFGCFDHSAIFAPAGVRRHPEPRGAGALPWSIAHALMADRARVRLASSSRTLHEHPFGVTSSWPPSPRS